MYKFSPATSRIVFPQKNKAEARGLVETSVADRGGVVMSRSP